MDAKLKADLFMFFSFVLLSVIVYVFHIIQSAGQIRGYITGLSLVIGWFILQGRENDRRLTNLWGSFMLWVIHSNVYFDVRTHYVGIFRFIKHVFFCVLVIYLQITRRSVSNRNIENAQRLSSFRNLAVILLFIYIALFPDLSTNAYGNAIFSILRVFCVTVLVMTRYKDSQVSVKTNLLLYEFVWVFFIHEFALPLTILQLLSDVMSTTYTNTFPFFTIKNKNYDEQSLKQNKMTKLTKLEQGNGDVIQMSDKDITRLLKR